MTRLTFLIAALRGPRTFSRFAFFYVAVMLFLFYCLIGGLPHVPASPAHSIKSPYPGMPQPKPVPANAAEELRKRMNGSLRATN